METRFEWDPVKAKSNVLDHGVSFKTAAGIFSDPFVVVQQNVADDGEQRYHAIGATKSHVLLLVVFVDRSQPEIEIIRIISARKADHYERSAYEDQFR